MKNLENGLKNQIICKNIQILSKMTKKMLKVEPRQNM